MINTNVFRELTPDVAYWVGYFSAGGNCTTENKVRLVTTPENEDLLISFRNFIGEETVQIRNFLYKGKYKQCSIDVRSDKLCESLDLYALRRSKDLIVPQLRLLKDEFVRDFVRGYFDADGSCFYDGQNKQWLFAEITGYLPMITVLRETLIKYGVIDETKKITRNGKIYRLRFPKESAKKLFKFIYNGKSGYALGRKRKMVEDYFEKVGESLYE